MDALLVILVLSLAFVFGGMVFFSAVMAPVVISKMDRELASEFLFISLEYYYLTMAGGAAVAALAAIPSHDALTFVMGVVCVSMVLARQVLLPKVRRLGLEGADGNEASARRFLRLNRIGFLLNVAQAVLAAMALVQVTTGIRP